MEPVDVGRKRDGNRLLLFICSIPRRVPAHLGRRFGMCPLGVSGKPAASAVGVGFFFFPFNNFISIFRFQEETHLKKNIFLFLQIFSSFFLSLSLSVCPVASRPISRNGRNNWRYSVEVDVEVEVEVKSGSKKWKCEEN